MQNCVMKSASFKFGLVIRYGASIATILSFTGCMNMSASNPSNALKEDKAKTNIKVDAQKGVEFKLIKVEIAAQQRVVGYYTFKNQSPRTILTPVIGFESPSVGRPSEIGFEVLVDGKWKNPGYYGDAMPLRDNFESGKSILLRVDLPVHLWGKSTPFRMTFGEKYISEPSKLDEMK
jgi:hypothetical protein